MTQAEVEEFGKKNMRLFDGMLGYDVERVLSRLFHGEDKQMLKRASFKIFLFCNGKDKE